MVASEFGWAGFLLVCLLWYIKAAPSHEKKSIWEELIKHAFLTLKHSWVGYLFELVYQTEQLMIFLFNQSAPPVRRFPLCL